MTTIKVGDRVKVLRSTGSYDPNGMGNGKLWKNYWPADMNNYIGKEYVVESIDSLYGVRFKNSVLYGFPLSVLQKIVEPVANGVDKTGNPFDFNASRDSKLFQRFVSRDGRVWMVAENQQSGMKHILVNNDGWLHLELTQDCGDSEYDILAVYDAPEYNSELLTLHCFGKLVWQSYEEHQLKNSKIKTAQEFLASAAEDYKKASDAFEIAKTALEKLQKEV